MNHFFYRNVFRFYNLGVLIWVVNLKSKCRINGQYEITQNMLLIVKSEQYYDKHYYI